MYKRQFLGLSAAEVASAVQRCRETCDHIGAEIAWDKSSPTPRTRVQYVGIDFDLAARRFRLVPSWASKSASLMSAAVASPKQSLLSWWRVFGKLLWSLVATDTPLCECFHVLQWMRVCARRPHSGSLSWSSLVAPPAQVLSAIREAASVVRRNRWVPYVAAPRRCQLVVSDASLSGWGYIVNGNWARWGAWLRSEHINVLELRAVLYAVTDLCSRGPVTICSLCDNTAVVSWLQHRRAPCPVANGLLRVLFATLRRSGSRLYVAWLRGGDFNPADYFTRVPYSASGVDLLPAGRSTLAIIDPDWSGFDDDDIFRPAGLGEFAAHITGLAAVNSSPRCFKPAASSSSRWLAPWTPTAPGRRLGTSRAAGTPTTSPPTSSTRPSSSYLRHDPLLHRGRS